MNNKTLPLVILAFTILLPLSALAESDSRFRVGVIAGFTGDWGAYGQSYRVGLELAEVEKDVAFFYEDDQFLPKNSIAAFHKLTRQHDIQLAIVGDTVTASALVPIAKKAAIPLMVWANEAGFTPQPNVVRLWPKNEADFGYSAQVIEQRGYKKISILTSAHTYASMWANELKRRIHGTETDIEEFSDAPTSYQPFILRAKQKGADAFGLCLNPGENGRFVSELRLMKMTTPVFGCSFLEASADLSKAREAFEGVTFFGTTVSPSFRKLYVARTGTTDHIISAAVHYDAAKAIVRVVKNKSDLPFVQQIKNLAPFSGAHPSIIPKSNGLDTYLAFPFTTYEIQGGMIVEVGNAPSKT